MERCPVCGDRSLDAAAVGSCTRCDALLLDAQVEQRGELL